MRQRKSGAFTLIELLIVAAIIGVLAAIAIPNFLQAQIRARIARAQSDAQAVGTALAMYSMDTQEFPPDGYSGVYAHHSLHWQNEPSAGKHLTTPVAYLTSIPIDPFNSNVIQDGYDAVGNTLESDIALYYINRKYAALPQNAKQPWDDRLPFYGRFAGKSWQIYSVGPSHRYGLWEQNNACWMMPYDSSNGLTSRGGIWRLG